jgi:dTDP-4-dehydrorhamnose 3,5-epimerase-like enzyme
MDADISQIKVIQLPHHFEENGDLVVMENVSNVPFEIKRVFVVRAPKGAIRGQHAHVKCTQLLTCTAGKIEVQCDDGKDLVKFNLNHPSIALLIPPGIWAQQHYLEENSILTVLCDRVYEVKDYIRDYNKFIIKIKK